jgi:type IV pilus assembly protein PilE
MRLTLPRRMLGVTLMELLIVVVVIGILASIAVPSYRNYVMRTHRTDATTMLLRIQSQQEKFFLQNNRYSGDLVAAPPAGLGVGNITEGGKYSVQIEPVNPLAAYTVTARPVANRGQDRDTRCQTFTIDEIGRRGARDAGGADRSNECWGRR